MKSAKDRTLHLPGVSDAEQRDQNPIRQDVAFTAWRVTLLGRQRLTDPPSTHLRSPPLAGVTMCGRALIGPDIIETKPKHGAVCQACRIEAARRRAEIK